MTETSIPVVSIRADCNVEIGYGHIMRCLSVAKALSSDGAARVRFLMTQNSDATLVETAGFEVLEFLGDEDDIEEILIHASPEDGPLLLDSYAINDRYLDMLQQTGYRVAIFDDGNRLDHYPCDVVIDSSPGAVSLSYRGLEKTRFCLGADYFPLRPEFKKQSAPKTILETARTIVVTFGGSDHDDLTLRVLRVMAGIDGDLDIVAVLGPAYVGQAEEAGKRDPRVRVLRDVADVAAVFSTADIAISGGGGTALELAYLGVPMVLLALSTDQTHVAKALSDTGAATYLGSPGEIEDQVISETLNTLIFDLQKRKAMNSAGRGLIDGKGAERIADAVLAPPVETIGIAS